jgi:hypothetical protein
MVAILNWGYHHWWLLWFLWIFGFFDGVQDFFLGIMASIAAVFHGPSSKKTELARARERQALAEANLLNAQTARAEFARSSDSPSAGGPCHHLSLAPVFERDGLEAGELLRWICKNPLCEKDFPPDHARFAEPEPGAK